jgi:hypothetical protein
MDQEWKKVESNVKELKRDSKTARDDNKLVAGLGYLDRAISNLFLLRSPSLSSKDIADGVERGVAEQLADCYGMKGGIFRQAKELEASIACYDLGYLYESCPRFKFDNSYNLLNRLLSRLMLKPQALVNKQIQVVGLNLRQALEEAQTIIADQTKEEGPRHFDPWAWGDLAVCKVLLQRMPDETVWNEFFGSVPSNHAHKTTANTLVFLLHCDKDKALPQEAITDAIHRLREKQAN